MLDDLRTQFNRYKQLAKLSAKNFKNYLKFFFEDPDIINIESEDKELEFLNLVALAINKSNKVSLNNLEIN